MKKIIGIFVFTLLIASAVFPLVSSRDKYIFSQQSSDVIINEYYKFKTRYLGKSNLPTSLYPEGASIKPAIINTPDYFSWKDYEGEDWTTPAKNQFYPKYCGSCWIFAAVGALESVINIREGCASLDPDLSEQYVLSCLPEAALNSGEGCKGGYSFDVYYYINDTSPAGNNCNGIIFESCLQYQADDDISCEDKCSNWEDQLVPISDHGYCILNDNPDDRQAIKTQIMKTGPVASCMLYNSDLNNWGYKHHDPNEYYPYDESGSDHDIIVVGWKDDPLITNGGYWIIKNSMGSKWGYYGFFNMEYGRLGSYWIDDDPATTYIAWVDYNSDSFDWPPIKPSISGPKKGEIGEELTFSTSTIDPNDRQVSYMWDWGDDTTSEWFGPFDSGETVNASHTWTGKGIYIVKVKAKNTDELESDWSNPLKVIMPRIKMTINHLLFFLKNKKKISLFL